MEYRILFRQNRPGGPKIVVEGDDVDSVIRKVADNMDMFPERGSFYCSIMINGGFGKNPKSGSTTELRWTGDSRWILDRILSKLVRGSSDE